jgi:predicted ATPase
MKIIHDVIPEVELIVGPQPSLPELGPDEAQHRFNLVFNNFVLVFATEEHPLTVEDVSGLIANFLRASKNSCRALSTLIYDKTGGNPFFVSEFARVLYDVTMIIMKRET